MTYGQRWILSRYKKLWSGKMHNNVFTIGINGINWNQLVTERKAGKGTTEQGKRNLQQKLYHQRDIVEQYGHDRSFEIK
jgi:hypothetical protein